MGRAVGRPEAHALTRTKICATGETAVCPVVKHSENAGHKRESTLLFGILFASFPNKPYLCRKTFIACQEKSAHTIKESYNISQ